MRARFISAHFSFSIGNFVSEIPYDPDLYFIGEEITLSIRALYARIPSFDIIVAGNSNPRFHVRDPVDDGRSWCLWPRRLPASYVLALANKVPDYTTEPVVPLRELVPSQSGAQRIIGLPI